MRAIYNFPEFVRGDTFRSRVFAAYTSTVDGSPIAISSIFMQIRTRSGAVVHTWTTDGDTPNATVTGDGNNQVTLGRVESSTTQSWPSGEHVYDLQVVFVEDNESTTKIGGVFPVAADVSRPN